jgi:hypothetical protein
MMMMMMMMMIIIIIIIIIIQRQVTNLSDEFGTRYNYFKLVYIGISLEGLRLTTNKSPTINFCVPQ